MRSFSLVVKKFSVFVALVFSVCGSTSAFAAVANDMISGAQVKQKINSFLAAQNLAGEPAISETRLFPACRSDIAVRPMFGGIKTVELFCPDPGGFKIAVRTNAVRSKRDRFLVGEVSQITAKSSLSLNVKGQAFKKNRAKTHLGAYLVLARSVQKGQVLSNDDVVLTEVSTKNRTGYFTRVSDVVGRKVKKKLSVNQIILNRHLEVDWAIREGQKIIIQSTAGPVVVASIGISKGNAQVGELIQAENQHSGKIVEGIVVSQKKIKVLTK